MAQNNSFATGFSVNTLGSFCPGSIVLVASTALMLLGSKANDSGMTMQMISVI